MKKCGTLFLALVGLSLCACVDSVEDGNDLCQQTYDCAVKNCKADEDEGDIRTCKGRVKKNLDNCKQNVQQNANAQEYLPKDCTDMTNKLLACQLSSFVCHEEVELAYRDGASDTIVYTPVSSGECQYLNEYVEKACTPEEDGNVIKLVEEKKNYI